MFSSFDEFYKLMKMLEIESDYIVTRVRRVWRSTKLHDENIMASHPATENLVLSAAPIEYTDPVPNLLNCSYLYDYDANSETHMVDLLSLYLDGPLTLFFAVLALIGGRLAVKFLGRARLNKDLTSALYILCFCDTALIVMVVIYHSIEATGLLLFRSNPMWDHQLIVALSHGLVSALTTSSTLLVVHISFQRFLVVYWPLKYSKLHARRNETYRSSTFRKISQNEENSVASTVKRCNSTAAKPPICHRKNLLSLKSIKPFVFPSFVVLLGFFLNISVFFEFELEPCYALQHGAVSSQLAPTGLRQNQTYNSLRTATLMLTQTIGPIFSIAFLTIITEFRVHSSLKARRLLFESQQRRRSLVQLEEMKEKISRFVAIFIATKFIILRSLPVLLDFYELVHGIEFNTVLTLLVRVSDFFVVLNTATNTFSYFGKAGWEQKLRGRLLKRSQTSNGESPSIAQSKKSILLTSDQTASVTTQLMAVKEKTQIG